VMRQYTVSLPLGAPPGIYQLRQIVYRGDETGVLELGNVVVTRPLHAPDAAALGVAPVGLANWGDLTLLAVGLDQKVLKPCESLDFTLIWQAQAPLDDDYTLRAALAGQVADQPLAAGWPTSLWQPGDVWRTRHHVNVPCRALDGPAQLQLTLLDSSGQSLGAPVSVDTVNINARRVFTPPPMQYQFQANLGGQVRLLGYDYEHKRSGGKSQIEVTLYWQATQEITRSLTVFTHVEGERLWGQHDGLPASGLKPTDRWVIGEIVADRHVLILDPAAPAGRLRLVAGMYDLASLERLPAFDASGRRWPDDVIVLREVVIP